MRTALPLFALLIAAAPPAGATEIVIDSQGSYWQVGPRNNDLSRLCSVGHFNEHHINQYTIQLHAKDGAAVLGIAKSNGFNLTDPEHHRQGGEDYFFRNDGTSSCQVFVGGRVTPQTKPPDPAAPPTKPAAKAP